MIEAVGSDVCEQKELGDGQLRIEEKAHFYFKETKKLEEKVEAYAENKKKQGWTVRVIKAASKGYVVVSHLWLDVKEKE